MKEWIRCDVYLKYPLIDVGAYFWRPSQLKKPNWRDFVQNGNRDPAHTPASAVVRTWKAANIGDNAGAPWRQHCALSLYSCVAWANEGEARMSVIIRYETIANARSCCVAFTPDAPLMSCCIRVSWWQSGTQVRRSAVVITPSLQ